MSAAESPSLGATGHRAFIGPAEKYDLASAMQFNLLTLLGLRENHTLLDIGCGSLRAGRLLMLYLRPGNYFGLEPEKWLVEEGIEKEIGRDMIRIKQPTFSHDTNFTLTTFGRSFDYLNAQSIFSHASQAQIRRCFQEARQVMSATSIFVATFLKGEQNYEGSEWVYPGCVRYTLEHLQTLAANEGLKCRPLDWPHPNSQSWVMLTDPKHEVGAEALSDGALRLSAQNEVRETKELLKRARRRYEQLRQEPWVRLGEKLKGVSARLRKLVGIQSK